MESVVGPPRLRRYFSVEEAAELLGLVQRNALPIDIRPSYEPICRDPKDDDQLALAKAGKANLLINGEADLLVLKKYGKSSILKPANFRKKYL